MEEQDLIRRAQEGDREAFGELVRRTQSRLRAYAAQYVPSGHDVFDLVQDAYLDALEHLDRFDPAQPFGPWLRAICRNRILNFFRSHRVGRSAAAALVEAALGENLGAREADWDAGQARVEALRRCLDELGGPHRELLDLRYRHGASLAELGRQLGRSAAALAMTLFRIRGILQRCMGRRLEVAGP